MHGRLLPKSIAALAMVASAFHLSAAAAQEAKLFRWKFQSGEKLSLRFDQKLSQSARVGDQPLNTTIDLGLSISWLVEKVADNGDATIVQTIESVQASMEAPPEAKLTYDSADANRKTPFARSVHAAVEPLLGVQVRQTISPRGEVLGIEAATPANDKAAPAKNAPLSSEQVEAILSQATVVFHEERIAPGYTWKQKLATGELTLTYAGEPAAELAARFTLSKALADPKADPSRPSLKIVDQKSEGFLDFDSTAGRIVGSELVTSATVETKLADEKVTSTLSTTTKLTVSRDE